MRRGRHQNAVTARLDRTLSGAALFERSLEADRLEGCAAGRAIETKQPSRSTGYIKGSIIPVGDKYEIDDEHNAPSVAARPLGPLR